MNSLRNTHNDQINFTNTILFLKTQNATSPESAIQITSEQWYELGFSLGAPLGSLIFTPIKRTSEGKYWYDQNSATFHIQLNRIFAIVALTIFLLILIYVISIIGQQNQIAQNSFRQPQIDFYTDRFLQE